MPRALISVSDKQGIAEFARGLEALGWEIISTGGTARALSGAGVLVIEIEDVTGFPEIMDGRIKTLHPAVHGGLLARRDLPAHMEALRDHGIQPIDLVAVNLYPFRKTVSRGDVTLAEAIEQIDIGGPTMLRSAAKNHAAVLVVVDPGDYGRVLQALEGDDVSDELRLELAAKVFAHTASYDGGIATFLSRDVDALPRFLGFTLDRLQSLRYGENPEQRAGLYATEEMDGVRALEQHGGKDLSFNNLLDIEGAQLAVAPWPARPACAVIKHTTPCGIALGASPSEAYRRALATDPTSAFGSVVAFSTGVDAKTAEAMADLFVEAVGRPRVHARSDRDVPAPRRTSASFSFRLPARTVLSTSSGCGEDSWYRSGLPFRPTTRSGIPRACGLPRRPSGEIFGSRGPRWRASNRTRFSWLGTRPPSGSARDR